MATAPAEPYPFNGGTAAYAGFSRALIDAVITLVAAILPEGGAIIRNRITLAGNSFAQNGAD